MTKIQDNEEGFAHLWILIVVVLLVVGGAGYAVMQHNQPKQVNRGVQATNASQVKPLSANLDGLLTTDKIQEITAQDKPGAKVSQIGLVQAGSGPVFHVQLADGSSLDLDARSGAKVHNAKVGDDSEGAQIPAGFTPAVDFAKAEQIAQGQVTQGSVVRIELKTEEGKTVYDVRFSTGTKVLVSATDGSVVKVNAAKAQGKQPASLEDPSEGQTGSSSSSGGSSGTSSSDGSKSSGSGSGQSGSGSSGSGSSSGGSGPNSGSDSGSGGSDDGGSDGA